MNILNQIYNANGYNHISRIGPVMKMCRELKPLTVDEWKQWYLANVHDKPYIEAMVEDFYSKASPYGCSKSDCREYMYDIMFTKTFMGYQKECQAIPYLSRELGCKVFQAPSSWDAKYFIDFYIKSPRIGIQLKPETVKEYLPEIGIKEKMQRFCNEKQASAFILYYRRDGDEFEIVNKDTLEKIKRLVGGYS